MQYCRVCTHTDQPKIDDLLRRGESARLIARNYGLTKDSLSRHKVAHLNLPKAWRRRTTAPAPPVEVPTETDERDKTATADAKDNRDKTETAADDKKLRKLELPRAPEAETRQPLSGGWKNHLLPEENREVSCAGTV